MARLPFQRRARCIVYIILVLSENNNAAAAAAAFPNAAAMAFQQGFRRFLSVPKADHYIIPRQAQDKQTNKYVGGSGKLTET